MLQFILTNILMLSLGAILYLAARSLPRVGEEPPANPGLLERWAASEVPEKIDAAFNNFLMKSLRKIKLVLLRIDNYLTKHIKKVSPNDNGKPKVDFRDINGPEPTVEKKLESGDN